MPSSTVVESFDISTAAAGLKEEDAASKQPTSAGGSGHASADGSPAEASASTEQVYDSNWGELDEKKEEKGGNGPAPPPGLEVETYDQQWGNDNGYNQDWGGNASGEQTNGQEQVEEDEGEAEDIVEVEEPEAVEFYERKLEDPEAVARAQAELAALEEEQKTKEARLNEMEEQCKSDYE